jgi:hypothetical protein
VTVPIDILLEFMEGRRSSQALPCVNRMRNPESRSSGDSSSRSNYDRAVVVLSSTVIRSVGELGGSAVLSSKPGYGEQRLG